LDRLEGRICPWVGCGGTIVSANHGTRRTEDEWICNVCGEIFVSLEGYKDKLQKESTWAKAWIEWSQEHPTAPETSPAADVGLTTEAN
jgi:hypothetical protein